MKPTLFAPKALARRFATPNLTGARAIAAAGVAGMMITEARNGHGG
jgi:hypothetical protein